MKARAISADNFLSIDFDIDAPHPRVAAFIRERVPVQKSGFVPSDLVAERTDEIRRYEFIGKDSSGVRIYREIYPSEEASK